VRSGGQILVDQLLAHDVTLSFCVPGESYLPVLDAFYDAPIRMIVARHEAGAANMADAVGKLSGRPGIAFVTRAPGATHAATGVFTAFQDSTPFILFVGQVQRGERGREAFQELDYEQFFAPMTKWVVEAQSPEELPEITARAFQVAVSGRPGPVVISLPEDVLFAQADVADVEPLPIERRSAAPADFKRLHELLEQASKPLIIVGGGAWTERASRDLRAFAEASSLPVATSFRRQDYFDNSSPSYVGSLTYGMDPELAELVRRSDFVLAVGTRLGDVATGGYTLLEPPRSSQTLVHVYPDPTELGRVYQADLAIVSDASSFAAGLEPVDGSRWEAWSAAARCSHVADRSALRGQAEQVDMTRVAAFLNDSLPNDSILAQGAGNFTGYLHRYYEFRQHGTLLTPCSGAMGYGVPAAVAAKALNPERTVICIAGDGDFLMSGHELSTATQEGLPIVVLLVNNGMYGTIRMHQEREYPGRVSGTEIRGLDFEGLARGFGAEYAKVETQEEFEGALRASLVAARPALLDLRVDPNAVSARVTLTDLAQTATAAPSNDGS
jgi:acetolactate synthase-1/2/3 large subunit